MNKALLDEINQDLPRDIDWKAGAREYTRSIFSGETGDWLTAYNMTKPMYRLNPGEAGLRGLDEAVQYLFEFANTLKLLRLTGGARVMDAACSGGWLSHYMAAMGFEVFGFDISEDYIALAKRRVMSDPHLGCTQQWAEAMFAVHDIESEKLGDRHVAAYDAIILQNALHSFFDPIAALRNLVSCLSSTGVILVFEGENRVGPIKSDYLDLMRQHRTIVRPFTRNQLVAIFEEVGLRQFEFLGQLNGLICPRDPVYGNVAEAMRQSEHGGNVAICAKTRSPIDRVLPGLLVETRSAQQTELDALRKRERELVDREKELLKLIDAITSSRGFRFVQFLQRLSGR